MKEKARNSSGGKRLLIILSICAFFVGLDAMLVAPLIPKILETTNAPTEKGGLLITAYALFYGLTAPLFGPISDKVGRKIMIVSGMFLFSIGTFLTGISHHFETILLFRAVTGIAGAIIMPSIFALVGDKFPDKARGKAMGMVMGAMIGSTVIGVPIGALITKFIHWQMTFWIVGCIAFLVFIMTFMNLPQTPVQKQMSDSIIKNYSVQYKTAFQNLSVLYALLTTFLWTVGLHGMFSYIGVFYHDVYKLDVGGIGIVILIAGLASVFGNIFGGKWSDKVGEKKVIYLASFSAALFVLGFSILTKHLVLSVFLHIIWSASIGVGQSSLTALVSQLSPRIRGTVMSLNSSVMYIGMTIASSSASFLLIDFKYSSLGVLCALSALFVLPVVGRVVETKNGDHPLNETELSN